MALRDLLLDKAKPMTDPELDALRDQMLAGIVELPCISKSDFIDSMTKHVLANPDHDLHGFDCFSIRHACHGVTHYIDGLLISYGQTLQMLEHDYLYYSRLFPNKQWSRVGNLLPRVPLLMALPFPGAGDVHPHMQDILQECLDKDIDVHLDCAWLPIARKISFDLSHPAIQSFAVSLSKGLSLGWNRIGVCYWRTLQPTNAVAIADSFDMINAMDMSIGYEFMRRYHAGYLWNTYGQTYDDTCRRLMLRPTNVLHLAFELGTNKPVGMRDVLRHLYHATN